MDTFLFCDYMQISVVHYFVIRDPCTECPVLDAISLRFLKTKGSVRGFGLNKVF